MNPDWWQPDHGFFGSFYELSDQSNEGFNASYKMSREERTEREVNLIFKYLALKANSTILDCPCGNGRHSVKLAQNGFDVVGVDINEFMLSLAHKQKQNFNIDGNLSFYNMDMRNLEFKDDSFDYIVNMFLSFGFFNDDDNEKVVKEFYRLLKLGGKLLIHLDLNYDRILLNKYLSGDQHISRECIYNEEYRILEIDESYDEKNKRLIGKWTLINGGEITKSYSLRVYDNQKEFIPLFKKHGFSSVTLHDPDKNIYDINSKETILVAIK
ncbi:MAG: class I SAM-dependent methyltransferase [Ignavibacteriaceae bacterium]